MSGWTMPCSRMESASSRRDSGGKIFARLEGARADLGHGHTADLIARHGRARGRDGVRHGGWRNDVGGGVGSGVTGAGLEMTGVPPNSAPRPRPKAGFDMRAE